MKKRILFLALLLIALALLPLTVGARDVSYENGLAADLRALGLFQGVSENNFDLERAPSRTEVLVMLIRVLGKEDAAKSGEWSHPFDDVPEWANPYVGYAYENGLTKGVSATKFGTDTATAGTYLTFMLRALGYSDADGDFAWNAPEALASGIGLLPPFADTENFWRADIVSISYAALSVQLKDKNITLAQKLVDAEVFSSETLAATYDNTKLTQHASDGKTVLTPEQIFDRCSPAIFYIEVKDAKGNAYASGSGFFIREDGVAVTNYHVIEGASYATITIPSTQKKYDVTGVYDFDRFDDWAVLQVDGSGFATLTADPLPLKTAVTAYAIGSPKGLQNTISTGIISSPRRVLGESGYIQTTAAISGGSSGGALLNVYGEVVGITCGTIVGGQSLNFACPISCIAGARLQQTISFADMTWAEVRYYVDAESVTLTVGEKQKIAYDYDWESADDDFPWISKQSLDESILRVVDGEDYGELYLLPQAPGTTALRFSNDVTEEVLEIPVTVIGEATSPKVEYIRFTYYEDDLPEVVSLGIGGTDTAYVLLLPYGVTGEELVAHSSDASVVTVTVEKDVDEDDPSAVVYLVKVKGNKVGEAEILLGNSQTEDTASFKIAVEDRFPGAYARLVEQIEKEGKDFTEDGKTYKRMTAVSDGATAMYFLVDTVSSDVTFRLSVSSPMQVSFDLTLDRSGKTAVCKFAMPAYNILAVATMKPEEVGVLTAVKKLDSFTGPSSEREGAKVGIPTMATTVMTAADTLFYWQFDDITAADLGFVNLYAAQEES